MAVTVTAPEALRDELLELLPPGWAPTPPPGAARVSVSVRVEDDEYTIAAAGAGAEPTRAGDPESALRALDARVRAEIALHAPDFIFLHAGVVIHEGRAIVLPGFTHSGKTTLVRALIGAGALYASDEFAVLDENGLVHPYAKPLSIRGPDVRAARTTAAALGAATASGPAPIGLVLVTEYRPAGRFEPEPLTAGEAVLQLLRHAVAAQTRPGQTMAFLRAALADAEAWRTARGDADETAALVLSAIPWGSAP